MSLYTMTQSSSGGIRHPGPAGHGFKTAGRHWRSGSGARSRFDDFAWPPGRPNGRPSIYSGLIVATGKRTTALLVSAMSRIIG
jgi:hypothetical protein